MSLSMILAVLLDALRIFAGYDGGVYGASTALAPATEDGAVWAMDGNTGPPPRK